MTPAFTLHGSPHSQFTYKVALMLRLAGQPFRFRYVSFQRGQHRTAEFRALSRWGQVPVLEHGARVTVQSGAMLEYLAETLGVFGASDPAGRQRIREVLYWNADRLAPPVYGCYGVRLGEQKLLPIEIDPVLAKHHRDGADAAFAALDALLRDRDYLAAGGLTIADICCYGEAAFARLSNIDLGPWPRVEAWARRIADLPGVKPPLELLPMADAEIAP